MRLLRLHVENFGTLHDFDLNLDAGLNVLHEENGWGKSTLAVFIKAMLYGMPATTKRSLDENERKKYLPWQGGAYGGSLEFSCAAGEFRIERFFGSKEAEDSFALYDLATKMESRAFGADVGRALFGIDEDSFERTFYLSQRTLTAKADNSSITARLGSLLDAVDDIDTYDGAIASLEKRQKYYVVRGGRGRVAELEKELSDARTELEALRRMRETVDEKEAQAAALGVQIAEASQKLKDVQAALQRAGHAEHRARMLEDLRALDAKKKDLEQKLHGRCPSDKELAEQRELLGQLRDAKARRDAIPSAAIRPERTELLTEEAYASSPKGEIVPKLERACGEWGTLCHDESLLKASMGASRRFAGGVPTDEEINAARRALANAQPREKETLERARGTWFLSWTLRIAAVCCLAAGFFFWGMTIVGIALVVAAIAVRIVANVRYARLSRENEAREMAEEARRQSDLQSVCTLLRRYGVQDTDPARGLDELSYLVRAYHDEMAAAREDRAKLEKIVNRKKEVIAFLRAGFGAYGVKLTEKNDYRDELEALKRDLGRFERAGKDEDERSQRLAAAKAEYNGILKQMQSFVALYDPEKQYTVSELLRYVEAWARDLRRVQDDFSRKNRELTDFMREKKMDAGEALADEETLRARESGLQNQLSDDRDKRGKLLSEIDNLSLDADRIPEVEGRIASLAEALDEAKTNSRTVDLTRDYLEKSKTALSTRYLDGMQESFDHYLSILTEGEPPVSEMDAEFAVSLRAAGKTRKMESFSRGWRDAVQFCVRLSLSEALCKDGERPFLLLDDPFVNLDDDRLTAAKRLLAVLSERYQIIHMVCHAERG
ncbi:MAG: AAA family ATPase [Clostridia bacterium]|nr:AAA family ATPase [Clostridia bacterium]